MAENPAGAPAPADPPEPAVRMERRAALPFVVRILVIAVLGAAVAGVASYVLRKFGF